MSRPRRMLLTAAVLLLGAGGAAALAAAFYIDAKALAGQVLLERAWAQTVETGAPAKPWSWADTWPVAKVTAPAHGKSAIVLAGASGEAMAWGPGHMAGTPPPGARGISVIAAHRDTHFAFLKEVAQGDVIEVARADGETHRFRVTGMRIVRWDASGIDPYTDGHRLALVTCYPFGATTPGPLRYVVMAERMDAPAETAARHASRGIRMAL